uniref:Uncharacterized protein n=1 Tax=Anguilla anguilla TaxID=7936 RepID=A0A0E9R1C0_ANGAN
MSCLMQDFCCLVGVYVPIVLLVPLSWLQLACHSLCRKINDHQPVTIVNHIP